MKARRNSSRLTYGHFYRTGDQDCGNAMSPGDFDLSAGDTAEEIVDAGLSDWGQGNAEWIAQMPLEDYEGLDPEEAFKNWRAGWRACAIRTIRDALEEKQQRDKEELTLYYLYSKDEPDVVIEQFDNLIEAVTQLAWIPKGGFIRHGDGNGPDYRMYETDNHFDRNPVAGTSALDNIFVKEHANGWHVEGEYETGEKVDYGPFISKGRAMKMREAMIESDLQRNPSVADDKAAAIDKYTEFHRYKPRSIGEFDKGFAIPRRVSRAGAAKWVTYRSGKVDPATLHKPRKPVNYIHEHDAGVVVYHVDDDGDNDTDVPKEFVDAKALSLIGTSLGYAYENPEGDEMEAICEPPMPELYTTPDGKCLIIVQSRRDVLAMIWGGALGVFARGIDG